MNQFNSLDDTVIMINKFDNAEEGARFLRWLDDRGIRKLYNRSDDMSHSVTRPSFYKFYNEFSDNVPANVIEQVAPTQMIRIPDNITVQPNKKLANGYFEAKDGKKIYFNQQGFPIFDSKYTVEVDPMFFQVERKTHFAIGNDMLSNTIKNDSALKSIFTNDELIQIKNGITPERFVWHHTQHDGVLELVIKKYHNPALSGPNHLGGDKVWGLGSVQ